jgi:hypothetical protein
MRRGRSSLLILAAVTTAVLLGAIAFNVYVDPYGAFGRLPEGVSPASDRIHFATALSARRPRQLMLGSSRAGAFTAPLRARDPSALTVVLTGTSIYEERRYLEHALAVAPVERVLLLLDFITFNAYASAQAMEGVLAVDREGARVSPLVSYLPALISLDALQASIARLRKGRPHGSAPHVEPTRSTRAEYARIACHILRPGDGLRPDPLQRFALEDASTQRSTLAEYERILALAHAHGVELTLIIPPQHAWLIHGVEALSLWPLLERWKRALVAANESAAQHAGKPAFALWSFEDFSVITTEEVPASGGATFRYFLEPSHFNTHVAELMLARVLDAAPSGALDFGALLTPRSIEGALEGTRQRLSQWKAAHPGDVAELAAIARGECSVQP